MITFNFNGDTVEVKEGNNRAILKPKNIEVVKIKVNGKEVDLTVYEY